jgi:hypothetical protein
VPRIESFGTVKTPTEEEIALTGEAEVKPEPPSPVDVERGLDCFSERFFFPAPFDLASAGVDALIGGGVTTC